VKLVNSFEVDRPVEVAWVVLTDLERIAPCLPGAQLTEIEGDEYRGLMKVKVGPIVAKYQGTATFASRDQAARVATIEASGRDPRQGNADAVITATLTPGSDGGTTVELVTDLSLSGKFASFGTGMIEDVAANLLGRFAVNLQEMLVAEGDTTAPQAAPPYPAVAPRGGARRIRSPVAEPLDLAAAAGAPLLKRSLPVVAGFALGFLVGVVCVLRLRRRR
jgi:carbon monoxide dehydrogenase subunit G